jgi:hypothetical protein
MKCCRLRDLPKPILPLWVKVPQNSQIPVFWTILPKGILTLPKGILTLPKGILTLPKGIHVSYNNIINILKGF